MCFIIVIKMSGDHQRIYQGLTNAPQGFYYLKGTTSSCTEAHLKIVMKFDSNNFMFIISDVFEVNYLRVVLIYVDNYSYKWCSLSLLFLLPNFNIWLHLMLFYYNFDWLKKKSTKSFFFKCNSLKMCILKYNFFLLFFFFFCLS